jgi:hypothetical protein
MAEKRTWRVLALINLPKIFVGKNSSNSDSLPESIKCESRLTKIIRKKIKDILISIGPWAGPSPWKDQMFPVFFGQEIVALSLITRSESSENALNNVESLIEDIIDDISFQIQAAIYILQLEVLDITPPINVGESREGLLFPYPNGYGFSKFSSSIPSRVFIPIITPYLRNDYTFINDKIRAALRWYIKGLSTNIDVDKFIFFWIALEILCSESDIVIKKPYVAPCGHEILFCPSCNRETDRVVNGETIKKFLVEKVGLKENEAKDLWKMRQLFHGANKLNYSDVKELPKLVYLLRHATFQIIKKSINISEDQFPKSNYDDSLIIIGNYNMLKFTRQIEIYDLDYINFE